MSNAPEAERREGGDRRKSGPRPAGAEKERQTGISVSRSFRRPSFFDHPWWVAGTVVLGILLGIGMMKLTDYSGVLKPQHRGIEVNVVP
jgi:hypothetical protein